MSLTHKIAHAATCFESSPISSKIVYKNLIRELKYLYSFVDSTTQNASSQQNETNKLTNQFNYRKSQTYMFYAEQFLQNRLTGRQVCRPENELLQRALDYTTYLRSSRELANLRTKYAKGEKSIADAAALCGLKLPPNSL